MSIEQKATRKLRTILSEDVKATAFLWLMIKLLLSKSLKIYRKIMPNLIKQQNGRVLCSPIDNVLNESLFRRKS